MAKAKATPDETLLASKPKKPADAQARPAEPPASEGARSTEPSPSPPAMNTAFQPPEKVQRVIGAVVELNAAIAALGESADKRGGMPEHLIFLSDVGTPGRPNLLFEHYRMQNATMVFDLKIEPKQAAPIPALKAAAKATGRKHVE